MTVALFQRRAGVRQACLALLSLSLLYWLTILYSTPHATKDYSPSQTSVEAQDSSWSIYGHPEDSVAGIYASGSSFRDRLNSYWPSIDNAAPQPSKRPQYSIKPVAYVFPQFHPIPENDKFWGENFTEWVNVNKMEVNKYGIKVQRPAKDVGYYNLLDLSTRRRWTQTIKESK